MVYRITTTAVRFCIDLRVHGESRRLGSYGARMRARPTGNPAPSDVRPDIGIDRCISPYKRGLHDLELLSGALMELSLNYQFVTN